VHKMDEVPMQQARARWAGMGIERATCMIVSVITSVLTLIGTIAGVIIGHRIQVRSRKHEFDALYHKEVLSYRMQLVERLTMALVKLSRVKTIMQMFEIHRIPYEPEFIKLAMQSDGKLRPDYFKDQPDWNYLMGLQKEIVDIHAEYCVVSNLSALYFGEKTRQAIRQASSINPWYDVDQKMGCHIVECMAKEAGDFD